MISKITPTSQFKRDLKKHYLTLISPAWIEVFDCLMHQKPLPAKYQDHELVGNYKGFKECHIKPDLLLIYQCQADELSLVRLGSHSELF